MATLQLKSIEGQIKLITGLHIGAGNDDIHIGGLDSCVVKDPDGNPYIPGSSLKGKIRSLLEMSEGCISVKNGPSTRREHPQSLIPIVFGDLEKKPSERNDMNTSVLTRLLVRDAFLSQDSLDRLESESILPTEAKSENNIDRLKGVAGSPRSIERAIPGLSFSFEMILRLFTDDNEQEVVALLKKGLMLLQHDALGGNGSRGYGKVQFLDLTYCGNPFSLEG